ncbi:MBL fold metallo-hydrolase [Desulfobacterales bacterium HSG2]|nr:MBL fold metallo-hydrolase [Desulfobacterales bacterium HSG2]
MQIFDKVHAFMWDSMTQNNCNTYLIDGPTRILIDPGHAELFDHVHEQLSEIGIGIEEIGLIICTHAHPDHIEAVQIFDEEPALVTLHGAEWGMVKSMDQYVQAFGISLDSITPDFFLKEGDLSVKGLDLKVFHTPGHSPGSVSLYWPDQKALFTGDVIFKGGLGRTDLPGGNGSLLKESIKRLGELADIEWVLPGHGNIISGGDEVRANFAELEQYWFNYL